MERLTAILLCFLACPAYAQERIPDLSMTPEETYRDFGLLPQNDSDNPDAYSDYNRGSGGGYRSNAYINTVPSNSFMTGYCDPKFKPVVENDCMDAQREQICEEFQRLPSDAQGTLDGIIGCMQSGDTADGENDPGCAGNDGQRLRLIKKYWRDEGTAHALTFMPDEIAQAGVKCMQGAH